MTRLRLGKPVWLAEPPPAVTYPELDESTSAEVVVVGGGLTGCSVALQFSDAGIETVLLEAKQIGLGSTAASTALLMQEPDRDFRHLVDRYGRKTAGRIWASGIRATRSLAGTLETLRIRCNLEKSDSLYFAHDRRASVELAREYRERSRGGIRAAWLDTDDIRKLAGFNAHGGILTRGNAQVDPYRACLGLARAASARGAHLFERSPVLRVAAGRTHVDVFTRRGRVRASRVIVATGYATREFASLYARFKHYTTYVIATPALDGVARRAGPPARLMLWDTRRPYNYLRWTPDRRLLVGGDDERQLPDAARRRLIGWHARRLHGYLTSLYPALGNRRPEYAWEGIFATTPDGLPYIGPHARYPRHLFALGYGGNGMTFGFQAARLLLDAHLGRSNPDADLFGFDRSAR